MFSFSACNYKSLDLAIFLDVSRKQGSSDFSAAREYLETFVSRLHIEEDLIRVALYTFDEETTAIIDFDDDESYDLSAILGEIADLSRGSSSRLNIANALKDMRERTFHQNQGDRDDATNIGILFIGGEADRDADEIESEGNECKEDGISLVGVGYDEAEIEQINDFVSVEFDVHQSYIFSRSELEAMKDLSLVVDAACVDPAWTGTPSCHSLSFFSSW